MTAGGYPEMHRRGDPSRRAAWARDYLRAIVERDVRDVADIAKLDRMPAATITAADFKGLRKLSEAAGDGFRLGLVLYDGDLVVGFGDRLHAAPVACLWSS